MRVAPRHGLDDAADFDRLRRIEDAGLTVMRVSNAHEHVESQDQAHEPHELSHVVSPIGALPTCPDGRDGSSDPSMKPPGGRKGPPHTGRCPLRAHDTSRAMFELAVLTVSNA